MQNGRNNRLDGRVPIPINRGCATGYTNAAKFLNDKKKQDKPGATSVINLPDGKPVRKTNVSNIPTKLPRVTRADENKVSQSIQKLLSVYENGEKSKGKIPTAEDRKPKLYGKVRTPERQTTAKQRVCPALSEKAKIYNVESRGIPIRKIPQKRKTTTQEEKAIKVGDEKSSETEKQLIPIMRREEEAELSADIINTIITNYLEDEPRERKFLLTGCDDIGGSVFPVCSKRATDNIPSSEMTSVIPDGRMPEKSELIVMLRRRNSEPYSPKSCLLQCDTPTAWNFGRDTVDNYYFWEPGPTHQLKPYWEISLFKSNRSLSVLSSRAVSGMLSLTPPTNSTDILPPGRFNSRKTMAETKPSWLREISSVTDDKMETMPFITLMEKGRVIAREPEVKHKDKTERGQLRVFSKDDQYKPPGHLLIYVKSSQKKLVTVDGDKSHRELNKKVHKIMKTSREKRNSEMGETWLTLTTWHKKMAAATILIIATAFLLLFYFLTKRHSFFNLTPPIPGLVRGC